VHVSAEGVLKAIACSVCRRFNNLPENLAAQRFPNIRLTHVGKPEPGQVRTLENLGVFANAETYESERYDDSGGQR